MGVSWLLDLTHPRQPFINRRKREVMVKHMSEAPKQSNSLYFTTEIARFYEHGNASSEVNIKGEGCPQW
jgi:hypothetical protein